MCVYATALNHAGITRYEYATAHIRDAILNDLPSTTDGYQLINRRVEGKLFPLHLPHRRPLRSPTAYGDTTWSPLCSSFPSHSFPQSRTIDPSLSRSHAANNRALSSFVSFPSGLVGVRATLYVSPRQGIRSSRSSLHFYLRKNEICTLWILR